MYKLIHDINNNLNGSETYPSKRSHYNILDNYEIKNKKMKSERKEEEYEMHHSPKHSNLQELTFTNTLFQHPRYLNTMEDIENIMNPKHEITKPKKEENSRITHSIQKTDVSKNKTNLPPRNINGRFGKINNITKNE